MAHVSKTAVSRLVASGSEEASASASRDDFKKRKELEEARKLAVAPAAVDEEGKDINPHIPQYISDVPWYYDPSGPSLRHQRVQPENVRKTDSIEQWYKRGEETRSKAVNKFRKGACDNCGAMTHSRKDCLERPRRIGAKFKAVSIAPDDVQQPDLALGFDGKRDRWNGYDSSHHKLVIEEYNKLEEVKRALKKERMRKGQDKDDNDDLEDDGAQSSSEDEDKYVDSMDMPGTKVDAAERYTVRNLRIREDTAKYLRNLDPNSAHYDPKTRAMRKNPYEGTARNEDELDYAGDNVNRVSGDTIHHARSQMFAWEAGARGLDVHALAEPTKLEALKKEYGEKKDHYKEEQKTGILEKYGGQEYLDNAPPRELIFSQTEHYVEYNRQGEVVKGQDERTKVRSKYEEDVYVNNHTTVFGSYYFQGQWAYKCCHGTVKNSVCTGQAGKQAASMPLESKEPFKAKETKEEDPSSSSSDEEDRKRKEERRQKKREKKKRKKKSKKSKKKSKDDSDESRDEFEKKVKAAMKKQTNQEKEAEKMLKMDERKRPYNSMAAIDDIKKVSEAEMEAYYRKRQRSEDPMANFK